MRGVPDRVRVVRHAIGVHHFAMKRRIDLMMWEELVRTSDAALAPVVVHAASPFFAASLAAALSFFQNTRLP